MGKLVELAHDTKFYEKEDLAIIEKNTIFVLRRNKRYFIETNDRIEYKPYNITFEKARLVRDVKQLYREKDYDIHYLFTLPNSELVEMIINSPYYKFNEKITK